MVAVPLAGGREQTTSSAIAAKTGALTSGGRSIRVPPVGGDRHLPASRRGHVRMQQSVAWRAHPRWSPRRYVPSTPVNAPPASTTIGIRAATSQTFSSGSVGDVRGTLGDQHVGVEVAVGPHPPAVPGQLQERVEKAALSPSVEVGVGQAGVGHRSDAGHPAPSRRPAGEPGERAPPRLGPPPPGQRRRADHPEHRRRHRRTGRSGWPTPARRARSSWCRRSGRSSSAGRRRPARLRRTPRRESRLPAAAHRGSPATAAPPRCRRPTPASDPVSTRPQVRGEESGHADLSPASASSRARRGRRTPARAYPSTTADGTFSITRRPRQTMRRDRRVAAFEAASHRHRSARPRATRSLPGPGTRTPDHPRVPGEQQDRPRHRDVVPVSPSGRAVRRGSSTDSPSGSGRD